MISSMTLFILQNYSDHFDNVGKINAVIAVAAVILIGIFVFLFFLERRIHTLEKNQK